MRTACLLVRPVALPANRREWGLWKVCQLTHDQFDVDIYKRLWLTATTGQIQRLMGVCTKVTSTVR